MSGAAAVDRGLFDLSVSTTARLYYGRGGPASRPSGRLFLQGVGTRQTVRRMTNRPALRWSPLIANNRICALLTEVVALIGGG